MTPRLSVVIPTHDTRDLTLSCVAALGAGGVPGVETILVDDGSQDGTRQAVRRLAPAVRILRNETPRGFTASANLGLQEARGDVMLVLNSDTEVRPAALSRLVSAFEERPRLGGAGGQLYYPDGAPQWSGGRTPTLLWLFALASGLPALLGQLPGYRRLKPLARANGQGPRAMDWVSGAALAIRRQVWHEVGRMDEGFRFYCQDLDYCLRLRRAGWEVLLLPSFEVLHHHGATIGQRRNVNRHGKHLELLWLDLVRWAGKEWGEHGARRAAAALRLGSRLRLAGLVTARPVLPRHARDAWRAEVAALRTALDAVSPASIRGGMFRP